MTAPASADPIDTAVAYLDDLRVLLDKIRVVSPFSAADLPDIKAALEWAIYGSPLDEHCAGCDKAAGGMCLAHHDRARLCVRWTELLHRLDGTAP